MYAEVDESNKKIFFQGDIIDDFPFLVITEKYNVLEKETGGDKFELRSSSTPPNKKEILAAFTLRKSKVILISQTCDIKNNNNVIVAPVHAIKTLLEKGLLTQNQADIVRKRRNSMKDWFYLPTKTGVMEESLVDFQTMHYLPRSLLNPYLESRTTLLSDWGRHLLSWALNDYFGRPIEDKYRI